MAVKINLLPQSYALERVRNRWIGVMGALFGLTALGIGLLYLSAQKLLEKVNADVAAAQTVATAATTAQTEAQSVEAEAAPIKGVVAFMADASKTGAERAALLDLVRRYIYQGAVISDLDLSGGVEAKIKATVRTPDEYARFLLALRRGTVTAGATTPESGKIFQTLPGASGVPGFPEGRRRIDPFLDLAPTPQVIPFPFQIDAAGRLREPGTDPRNALMFVPAEPPGTAGAAVAGAAGGAAGGYPGGAPPSTTASPSASPGSAGNGAP